MPWCRSRHASGQAPHAHLDPCCWPPFFRARRLVVSPNAGAVQKRHPELNPTLLGQEQQPLPHAQVGPADEGLSRSRPGTKLSRDGAPLGPVLMPPDNGRNRAPQILGRGLALGAGSCSWDGTPRSAAPASSIARPKTSLLLSQKEQNARKPIQFKREQALEEDQAAAAQLCSPVRNQASPERQGDQRRGRR